MMGAAYDQMTLPQYQAVLAEWNDRHSGDAGPHELDEDRVRTVMAAQSVH
jgi:hypothetical protein